MPEASERAALANDNTVTGGGSGNGGALAGKGARCHGGLVLWGASPPTTAGATPPFAGVPPDNQEATEPSAQVVLRGQR